MLPPPFVTVCAKAVSSFPDDEKKRASVLCMQANGTVSTHSLTVLSWRGVERLLNFSCAPIALPFLDWMKLRVREISRADDEEPADSLATAADGARAEARDGQANVTGRAPLVVDTTSPASTSPHGNVLKAEMDGGTSPQERGTQSVDSVSSSSPLSSAPSP